MLRTDGQRGHGVVYRFAVDTFASMSFFTPICMANEIYMAKMTVGQSLARLIGNGSMLSAGRPYGKFRDYAVKNSKWMKTVGSSKNT